jgi:hypothetical protein
MTYKPVSAEEIAHARNEKVIELVQCPGCPEPAMVDAAVNDGHCWYHGRNVHGASDLNGHDHL